MNQFKRKLSIEKQPNSKITKKSRSLPSINETIIEVAKINYENRLTEGFFDENCLSLAKKLLNKFLVRKIDDTKYAIGKIVEVEAYLGGQDKASHSYNNKQTDRVKAMYMKAGTIYVYNIYGLYCCLNISSKEPGAAVLIRALEPVYGVEHMKANRNLSHEKLKDLSNGPSKLCVAMNITKDLFNQVDLSVSKFLWLQNNLLLSEEINQPKTVSAKRIGIDYAGEEAINKLYRFYLKDNKFVSVKSKEESKVS